VRTRPVWPAIAAGAVIALGAVSAPGRRLGHAFFASLRLPPPEPVAANPPSFPGTNANRQLQDMVAGMISAKVTVGLDEKDQVAPNTAAADRIAGFAARLPAGRADTPVLTVTGARSLRVAIDRGQLQTVLTEAGAGGVRVPPAVDGALVTVTTPRGVRAQYGSCPEPGPPSIQAQIQGPPPQPANVRTCVVISESPPATAAAPAGFDPAPLVEIGLELAGMSPREAHALQARLDWKSALALSLPRTMRSYDTVAVNSTPAVLFNTAGRRGPTYDLVWVRDGVVFSLAGYGNPADAVPLANSIH